MNSDYTLGYGTHATPADGHCAMEWVSHLAGEPHGDEPACVSPVLRALCIALNDGLADEPRQRLRPYLTRTIGTAGDGLDGARAWLAMDWLVRTYTPAWLALAGLTEPATQLEALPAVIGDDSLRVGLDVLDDARHRARQARIRAFGGSGATAWASALTRGRYAREAAWSCAGAAAWAAARVAIGERAGDRARATARATAGDAAAVAVRRLRDAPPMRRDGRAGARADVARALAPTLDALAD